MWALWIAWSVWAAPAPFEGPASSAVDIIRPFPHHARIYVQATLPDGALGLFLVDTGADISVLSRATANRLHLPVQENYTTVWGLGGTAPMHRAVLPELRLGEMRVPEVEVAVDVRGVHDEVGFLPLDGILGNNVWSRFTLEIDYPADLLVLHDPDRVRVRGGQLLQFDGSHLFTLAQLTPNAPHATPTTVIAQLDTGAGGVILCGAAGASVQASATQGIESIYGVGASETLPPYQFYRETRRVPLATLALGGRRQEVAPLDARWITFAPEEEQDCSFDALIGHDAFARWRVWFDYRGQRVALARSHRTPRAENGHARFLAQELAAHGDDPTRALYRAQLSIGAGEVDAARTLLEGYVGQDGPDASEARVLLAQIARAEGDLPAAWAALQGMSAAELVAQGEIVRSVNGLLLEGRTEEARGLAERAVSEAPESGDAQVALSDVWLAQGRTDEASGALKEAAQLAEFPDAHLLRRARIALAAGDRYGALADIRRLLQLYPGEGLFLWYYASLVEAGPDQETFAADLDAAMARLHPQLRPLDFLVVGYRAIGDVARAQAAAHDGVARDCAPLPAGPEQDNCFAWYWALAGERLDDAEERITRALAAEGDRSDFLDTRAMVSLARGAFGDAAGAARRAAALSPDDPYMLWQADRLRQRAAAEPAAPPRDQEP